MRLQGSRWTAKALRSTASIMRRQASGLSGSDQAIISYVNTVRVGLTASMILRAFSTAASKKRGVRLSGCGPNQLVVLKEPAMSTQQRAPMASASASPSVTVARFCRALVRIGVEQVHPAAHLGDRHVVAREGSLRLLDPVRVGHGELRTVRGAGSPSRGERARGPRGRRSSRKPGRRGGPGAPWPGSRRRLAPASARPRQPLRPPRRERSGDPRALRSCVSSASVASFYRRGSADRLVAQELSDRAEPLDVVAHDLDGGHDRNGQQQSRIPQSQPQSSTLTKITTGLRLSRRPTIKG